MSLNRDRQLQQIIDWADSNEDIRVVLLTSSLANPDAPSDRFSDLDIEFVVRNHGQFLSDDSWLSHFGNTVATIVEDESAFDGKCAMRMVFYEDYTKVDFKVYSIAQFETEVNAPELQEDWDVGYKVLLDKDNLTGSMKPATYQSVLISKPTEKEYNQVLNDLWWDMTYVAKCLWRKELFYAKFMTEDNMRTAYLVPMLEWYIGMQHDWKITTNKRGRLFTQYLDPAMWTKVEATFSGSNIAENWQALFAYAHLGRELGQAISARLGYHYPSQLDEKISTYLEYVYTLPPK